jgi:hypothetical protein
MGEQCWREEGRPQRVILHKLLQLRTPRELLVMVTHQTLFREGTLTML